MIDYIAIFPLGLIIGGIVVLILQSRLLNRELDLQAKETEGLLESIEEMATVSKKLYTNVTGIQIRNQLNDNEKRLKELAEVVGDKD